MPKMFQVTIVLFTMDVELKWLKEEHVYRLVEEHDILHRLVDFEWTVKCNRSIPHVVGVSDNSTTLFLQPLGEFFDITHHSARPFTWYTINLLDYTIFCNPIF